MLARVGPGLVLLFAFSQAFRDVYFAGVFQGVDFFSVILIAFSFSTLLFGALALIRDRESLSRLRTNLPLVLGMNVTTAVAWSCYFFSLGHLQPSIVNTLHSGAGPLTAISLSACGVSFAKSGPVPRAEYACHAGLAASLVFLWWVVLSGHSGLSNADWRTDLLSLCLLLVSGASITVSLLLSKRLSERGIGAEAITAVRYLVIVAIALVVTLAGGRPSGIASLQQAAMLLLATAVLMVLPLYAMQVGIGRTGALTAQVIRALGPVFVFALELADGRIAYAPLTLAGIVLYSGFCIAANLLHAAHGLTRARPVTRSRRPADVSAAAR